MAGESARFSHPPLLRQGRAVASIDVTSDVVVPAEFATLPSAEFAFPGSLRDRLVAAILDGSKVSTTALLIGYELEGSELPQVGNRSLVVDSHNAPVAVIEVTDVRVVRLAEVDLAHCEDEGEGHATLHEWRVAHEDFWLSDEVRAETGPEFVVDDETPVVLERFTLVTTLTPPG
jgi:uncharacterized protein YhfF